MADRDPAVVARMARIGNIFMIVAFTLGALTIVAFVRAYPRFWYAAVLFLVIAVVGILKRIAILRGRLPANYVPRDDEREA